MSLDLTFAESSKPPLPAPTTGSQTPQVQQNDFGNDLGRQAIVPPEAFPAKAVVDCEIDLSPTAAHAGSHSMRSTPPVPRPSVPQQTSASGSDRPTGNLPDIDEQGLVEFQRISRQLRQSNQSIPSEFLPKSRALFIEGTLFDQPHSQYVQEQTYRRPYPQLSTRQRLQRIFSDVGLRIKLGNEILNSRGKPAGGMNRVFRAIQHDTDGTSQSVVVKILDPELIAQTSNLDLEQITDQFMASLIQYQDLMDGLVRESADRFVFDVLPAHLKLRIIVLRNHASAFLHGMGITIQDYAPGEPLHSAAPAFIERGLTEELEMLGQFEKQTEKEIATILRPLMNSGVISIRRSIVSARDNSITPIIADLAGRQNAKVHFTQDTSGQWVATVYIYDK